MFPLGMIKVDSLNLLEYVEDVAKADIGPMNVDQQETNKATFYHQEVPRPPGQMWYSHSRSLWRIHLPGKI